MGHTNVGKWIGIFVAFFTLFYLSQSSASEIRIGAGKVRANLIGDGIWQQTGLDNKIDNGQSNLAVTFVGNTKIRWLDYGIGFHYINGPVATGEFVSDACYDAKQFSGDLFGGVGYCDRRYFAADVSSKTYGINFTVNPTWRPNKNTSLSLGIGGKLFTTKEKLEFDAMRGFCTQTVCETSRYRETAITPYVEATLSYRALFITFHFTKDVGGPNAMSGSVMGWLAGARHEF